MPKPIHRFLASAALLALCLAGAAGASHAADELESYRGRMFPADEHTTGTSGLKVTYLGVTTLLFDDGETAIMTDGFFSRPETAGDGRIAPDHERIRRALQRAGVTKLAAVIPMHSHFDHAMDAPVVAQQTGALLVGSSSTANIGRGYGLPEKSIRIVNNGTTLRFGRFKVTFIESRHFPIDFAPGDITRPLRLPARVTDYKMGTCYTLLIEHDGHTLLVQGSAGYVPHELAGRKVDVAYLGIGGLGSKSKEYQDAYWHELIQTTGARRAIGIHWDDFSHPHDDQPQASKGFDASMQTFIEHGERDDVDVRVPVAWKAADPLAGLE